MLTDLYMTGWPGEHLQRLHAEAAQARLRRLIEPPPETTGLSRLRRWAQGVGGRATQGDAADARPSVRRREH